MMMRKLISSPSMRLFMMTFFHLHFFLVPVRLKTQMCLFKRHSGLCRLERRLAYVCVLRMCVCVCVCVYVCVCERRKREREWQVSFKMQLSTAK